LLCLNLTQHKPLQRAIPAGFDDAELLKGLPNNACQCEHWGYLFKGSLRYGYTDGCEEVVSAGRLTTLPSPVSEPLRSWLLTL
jgi:hypothetical protein